MLQAILLVLLSVNVWAQARPGSENSLYQLDSQWVDQSGASRKLKDFQGKFTVVSMVYLTCRYTCPAIVQRMKDLERGLPADLQKQTSFVLVSFDPKRDSPAKLREQMKLHKLDSAKWTFLTAKTEREPRELAAALGFQYQKMENGEFTHSFRITALDKEGNILGAVERGDQDATELMRLLRKDSP